MLFVFDLYSNMTFHFEGGKYHLAENVVVYDLQVFRKTISNTIPLFSGVGDVNCIVLSPLPKYLFTGCCNKSGHCSYVFSPSHASSLLLDTIGLRAALKKSLAAANLSKVRILDTCCASECAPTDNETVRLDRIRGVMSTDSIHYSQSGYKNLTSACLTSAALLQHRATGSSPCVTCKGLLHYWRGFCSPIGATAGHDMRSRGSPGPAQRGRGHWKRLFHPFHR